MRSAYANAPARRHRHLIATSIAPAFGRGRDASGSPPRRRPHLEGERVNARLLEGCDTLADVTWRPRVGWCGRGLPSSARGSGWRGRAVVQAVCSLPGVLQQHRIGLDRKVRESLDEGRLLHDYAAPFRGRACKSEISLATQPAQGGEAPDRWQVERAEALGEGDRE
jgi:hypothetical protein